MAEAIGLNTILKRIEAFAAERGNQFNYWTPSPLLVERAHAEQVKL
jgi:3-hydroxyacyl-CoA dehydrogenase